jgi:ribose transport system ATP-binding protein
VLRPQPGGLFDPRITAALTATVGPVPVAFVLLVVVAVGLQIALRRTRIGVALRAVGSDSAAGRLNGLRPRRVRLVGFAVCSVLAGLGAAFLMAQVGSGDPNAGIDYTLTSVSAGVIGGASIFGGRGSFVGTVAAAFLVTQAVGIVQFLGLDAAWSSYLPGAMTLVAVALYSKSRQVVARSH